MAKQKPVIDVSAFYRERCDTKKMLYPHIHDDNRALVLSEVVGMMCDGLHKRHGKEVILNEMKNMLEKCNNMNL